MDICSSLQRETLLAFEATFSFFIGSCVRNRLPNFIAAVKAFGNYVLLRFSYRRFEWIGYFHIDIGFFSEFL
jgi:hypothetical protein